MPPYIRTCFGCGQDFESSTRSRMYCSVMCRKKVRPRFRVGQHVSLRGHHPGKYWALVSIDGGIATLVTPKSGHERKASVSDLRPRRTGGRIGSRRAAISFYLRDTSPQEST